MGKKGLHGHVRTNPKHHISLCYQRRSDFIVGPTVVLDVDLYFKLDRIKFQEVKVQSNLCLAALVVTELLPTSCLQVGKSSSFIFTA